MAESEGLKEQRKHKRFCGIVGQKLIKCSNVVLLEDVICSGRRTLHNVRCDRNCFLFWHTAWLEKCE
jgi:hypothetical protein